MPPPAKNPPPPTVVGWLFHTLAAIFIFFITCFFLAIILECIGIRFWWPEQGVQHTRDLLQNELKYLDEFPASIIVGSTGEFARGVADKTFYALEKLKIIEFLQWVKGEGTGEAGSDQVHNQLSGFAIYFEAAVWVTQVFAVRLSIMILSIPILLLFGLVGLADGLVMRDVRRWSGGRESAFVYHHAKRTLHQLIFLPWLIYLALPLSLHPNSVVVPFAVLFAVMAAITANTFKKYL